MALVTLGTTAQTSLTALNWNPMSAVADVAAIAAGIRGQDSFASISPGAFAKSGRLHFPGRKGFLLLLPGDYVAFDSNNWPIVVSSQSIADSTSPSWVHT